MSTLQGLPCKGNLTKPYVKKQKGMEPPKYICEHQSEVQVPIKMDNTHIILRYLQSQRAEKKKRCTCFIVLFFYSSLAGQQRRSQCQMTRMRQSAERREELASF
eukprot:TRINITY_DN4670_c0_g2_i2.p1 TRINITY_DN4670_c0_g2~~TRINITY_DN4670_c0_g2_i2.p1  ORF type:complete len:116 (-),score=33.17 TRINITY_DN4670_c0_g2_i2:42-353(-)